MRNSVRIAQKICIILFFISQTPVFSQSSDVSKVTDQQLIALLQEAEKRGLSESDVEKIALSKGYTAQDIATIRERLNRIQSGNTTKVGQKPVTTKREQLGELSDRVVLQDTEKKPEKETVNEPLSLFGRSIFNNPALSFEANLRIPTPKDYLLGPDDQLKVDISGYAYQHYDLTVSQEGTVRIESLAPIYVNGLTVEQAKQKLEDRLRVLFGGLRNGTLSLDVTLGNVRSIKVTLIGEVERPGTYTVSSLSTVFNALYLAGGPNQQGSMRTIQLVRQNKVIRTMDLYEFLQTGIMTDNVRLFDQDVIRVPIATTLVQIKGEVRKPALFEMKSDETFSDALQYAGGFTDRAYRASVSIERFTSKEKSILTLSNEHFSSKSLQDGDKVKVDAILNRFENRIEISGAVFRPGFFALNEQSNTLRKLVELAGGIREDAFSKRILVRRLKSNGDPELISLNLATILSGVEADFALQREDIVIIKSITELREVRSVEIRGAVVNPGEFEYSDQLTVSDLILLAGGYREGASSKKIEIARRLSGDEKQPISTLVIDLVADTNLSVSAMETVLMPFDVVFVRDLPNYQAQQVVKVQGEVFYPGDYALSSREDRIADVLNRAGGLRESAFLDAATLTRDGKVVAVRFNEILKNPSSSDNLILEGGDILQFPKNISTVTIGGQVLNPTTVAYQPSYRFSDYISMAGGYTDSARVKKSYVKYANGFTARTKNFLGFKDFPEIKQGTTIVIPTHQKKNSLGKADIISLTSSLVSLTLVLSTLIRTLNQP